MAAILQENNLVHTRLRNALMFIPIRRRVDELVSLFSECTLRELQAIYPILVESIFGVSSSYIGWNLRKISRYDACDDFDAIFKFLHPQGALFDVIYKLLVEVYFKYEYNIDYLPKYFRQLIEHGNIPPFYMEKLNVDPVRKRPISLSLNSFEFYMFHFAFHLVSPWHARSDRQAAISHETVYLHLSDHYLVHLFPIETSVVLPVVHAHQPQHRSPPLQVQSARVSKLFKASALKHILANTSPPVVSQPHAEIWRSEAFLHIIIYFWLDVPELIPFYEPKKQMSPLSSPGHYSGESSLGGPRTHFGLDWQDMRAGADHLRVVRNLIKHVHYFTNNIRNDGSAMDEMRRSIRNVLQRPLFAFLRHNIHHWPLDSSFLLMLETYLSYIQPWRYQRYDPARQAGRSTHVEQVWAPFITDNLEAYTAIISELISRFGRMDLSSPRHAHMVYRLAKVLAEPDLPTLLYEADLAAQTRNDQDGHVALFTNATERQVTELLRNMRATSALVSAQDKAAHAQTSSSFIQMIRDFLFVSSSDDYSSSDRQTTVAYLDHAVQWFSRIFGVDAPDPPPEPCAPASVQPSLLDPLLAQKRATLFKYEGNPDLQPIRSTELAPLVRFLHQVSTSINQEYGPDIAELWYRDDLCGRISRQFLAPPCHTHYFQKSGPGNPAPRVTTLLPPRVCLRPLASHRVLLLLTLIAFLPYLLGYSPPLFYFSAAVFFVLVVLMKVVIGPFFHKSGIENQQEQFVPLDISFNE